MRSPDLYTKIVLTMIAVFLAVLCVEQSHWNHLQTVQATGPQPVVISGFVYDGKFVDLGAGYGKSPGVPVQTTK